MHKRARRKNANGLNRRAVGIRLSLSLGIYIRGREDKAKVKRQKEILAFFAKPAA
jgi:hypothetical protein